MGLRDALGRLFEDDSSRSLRHAREARERARLEFESRELSRVSHESFGYSSPFDLWSPLLDRVAEYQSDPASFVLGGPGLRKRGQNWPVFQTEQELDHYRTISRGVYEGNSNGKGFLQGLTSFVVCEGMTLRATTDRKGDDSADRLVSLTQDWLDEFEKRNNFAERQQEVYKRSKRDGEAFVRLFLRPDGSSDVRFVWPEHVYAPPAEDDSDWSFGVLTEPGDAETVLAYAVHDPESLSWSAVNAAEVEHFKCNVDSGVKRGLPEFCLDLRDLLEEAKKVRRNTAHGAAIQAAIAWVRQHEQASVSQVNALTQANRDFQAPRFSRFGNDRIDSENFEPGTILDVDKGQTYVPPPPASNAVAHAQVVQMLLRLAAARWNAPEGLVSGDYSNNNFASALVAESPFRRTMSMEQGFYKRRFTNIVDKARRHAVACGLLPAESLGVVEIQVEPPELENRNPTEVAQRDQIYNSMRVKSAQTISQEQGLDYEQEQSNFAAAADSQGSEGQALPLPGDPTQDQGPPNPFESMSFMTQFAMEQGFTGTITDARGAKRKFVQGKQVKLAASAGGGKPPGEKRTAAPAPGDENHREQTAPTERESAAVERACDPEGKAPPGKVREVYGKVKAAATDAVASFFRAPIHNAAQVLDAASDALLLNAEEFGSIFFGNRSALDGQANDPVSQALGLSPVAAAKLLSSATAKVLAWAKSKLAGPSVESAQGDDPQAQARDLLRAIGEAIAKALEKALEEGGDESFLESGEYLTEWAYEQLSFEAREGLVRKVVTDSRGVKRTYWVRPAEAVAAQKKKGEDFRA
jgi:hypothetical protein